MAPNGKRERLAEIVSRMGEHATPPEIREEAYRVGFGVVNGHMLKIVRNELWPDRAKHSTGPSAEAKEQIRAEKVAQGLLSPCPQCGSHQTWSLGFYRRRDGEVIRTRSCKECGHRFKRAEDGGRIKRQDTCRARAAMLKEKECKRCGRILPIDAYRFRSNSEAYRRPWCKECEADYSHKFVLRNALRQFGLTQEQYEQMLIRQEGRCAICRTDNPFGPGDQYMKKRKRRIFSLDHCHSTGRVRGLLCSRCNLAIGMFGDDKSVLGAAIAYIDHHKRLAELDSD